MSKAFSAGLRATGSEVRHQIKQTVAKLEFAVAQVQLDCNLTKTDRFPVSLGFEQLFKGTISQFFVFGLLIGQPGDSGVSG